MLGFVKKQMLFFGIKDLEGFWIEKYSFLN